MSPYLCMRTYSYLHGCSAFSLFMYLIACLRWLIIERVCVGLLILACITSLHCPCSMRRSLFALYSLYTTQIDYIMRLCLITDSHGKEMDDYIRQIDPSVEVFSIIRGSNMSVIYQTYLGSISELRVFSPDVIILHIGPQQFTFSSREEQVPNPNE